MYKQLMDSVEQVEVINNEERLHEPSSVPSVSATSPDIDDLYGEPHVLPRIGDQYQVDIPPLPTEWCKVDRIKNTDMEGTSKDYFIQMGLPIPVTWVLNSSDHIQHETVEPFSSTTHTDAKFSLDSQNSKGKQIDPKDCSNILPGHQMMVDLPQLKKSNLTGRFESQEFYLVPGSSGEHWSDFEQEGFLLGLYIFGKNFGQVKFFMEGKQMGDILSFYYGKFYGSDKHRRWSDCRKARAKRVIHGQRIFTGSRQQELLSRLLLHVPEEHTNTLVEVSKAFGEGKLSLEEYITNLKATVGLGALVEAVAIGKGKHDLTVMVMESTKVNQVTCARPEIPVGRACSSLSSTDIIKFLTGDFRLSKARSNDLFWEAVWPRLLARGWHSEQPNNQGYVNSNNSLVFLLPGIKKFSRRKLLKGSHYFDSVSDVLCKVASDPKLLELETEALNGCEGVQEEYGWDMDGKLDQVGASSQQHHGYLRPRSSNSNKNIIKFTVVDTSLAYGKEPHKVRQLRTLPMEAYERDGPESLSRETDSNSSQDQVDETDSNSSQDKRSKSMLVQHKRKNKKKCLPDGPICADPSDHILSLPQKVAMDGPVVNDTLDDQNPGKSIQCQFNRRLKSGRKNHSNPVTKRRRLNACGKSDRSRNHNSFYRADLEKEGTRFHPESFEVIETMSEKVGPSGQKNPTSSSDNCSPHGSSEHTLTEMELPHEKPKPRTMIDLNLPHVPPDFETGELFMPEVDDCDDGSNTKEALVPSKSDQQPKESKGMGTSGGIVNVDQPITNGRRHSTRNRPLTTRALEALACGYLNPKRRARGSKVPTYENSIPRSSRRKTRNTVGPSRPTSNNDGNDDTDFSDSKVQVVKEESDRNIDLSRP